MTEYSILLGDVLDRLREMPDGSIHCCVTSPPYWGLRDYGVAGQLGLEKTPDEYIQKMVEVFREVKRVLRDDGTFWLNIGDSYAGSWGNYGGQNRGKGTQRTIANGSSVPNPAYDGQERRKPATANVRYARNVASSTLQGGKNNQYNAERAGEGKFIPGIKPKDLIGIPWMLAFALRADGWYLRSDVIWAKKAPMPESVTDRPTSAHEHIFLLTKNPKYFYDAFAVRTQNKDPEDTARRLATAHNGQAKSMPDEFHNGIRPRHGPTLEGGPHGGYVPGEKRTDKQRGHGRRHAGFNDRWDAMERQEQSAGGANLRNVWHLGPSPFSEAHFATFVPEVPLRCIKAGTSEKGVCPECGSPWKRIVKAEGGSIGESWHSHEDDIGVGQRANSNAKGGSGYKVTERGWKPGCEHNLEPIPATVLDPFCGAATTGIACLRLSRAFIGIELNEKYIEIAERRMNKEIFRLEHPEPVKPAGRLLPPNDLIPDLFP